MPYATDLSLFFIVSAAFGGVVLIIAVHDEIKGYLAKRRELNSSYRARSRIGRGRM